MKSKMHQGNVSAKKVILLAPTPPPEGGIAGWTVRMMDAHLKNGWQVKVVDEKYIGNINKYWKTEKKNFIREFKRCCRIWRELKEAVGDPDTQVVHSCIPSYTFGMMREYICARITKHKGKKFIIHFRCTVPNTTKGRIGNAVLRKLCNKSDGIISLNQQTTNYLSSLTDTPITLIPNFVSETELVQEHVISQRLNRVLYVGGLVEDKGIWDVLKIAEHLPDIEFRLVGTGDEMFKEYADTHHLDNIVFVGRKDRDGVREELKNADVFLFMTYFRGEGFSNALCEAMAAGLPCVATDWAANMDMIGTSGGAVVKVGDVEAAVSALNVMRSQKVRMDMSENNLKKVREKYIQSVVVSQYVDAYEAVLMTDK